MWFIFPILGELVHGIFLRIHNLLIDSAISRRSRKILGPPVRRTKSNCTSDDEQQIEYQRTNHGKKLYRFV